MEFEIYELTETEKNLLIEHRREEAKKAAIKEKLEAIRKLIAEINALNGTVYLPPIGGKYIRYHRPKVDKDITIEYYDRSKPYCFSQIIR